MILSWPVQPATPESVINGQRCRHWIVLLNVRQQRARALGRAAAVPSAAAVASTFNAMKGVHKASKNGKSRRDGQNERANERAACTRRDATTMCQHTCVAPVVLSLFAFPLALITSLFRIATPRSAEPHCTTPRQGLHKAHFSLSHSVHRPAVAVAAQYARP